MARTKQTARKSTAQMVPRKQLVAQKIARKSVNFRAASQAVEADDEDSPIGFSQFSLKFDDQKECEKKAQEVELIRCSNCNAVWTSHSKTLSNKEYENIKKEEIKEGEASADEVNAKYLSTKARVWICEFCCQHNELPNKAAPPKELNPCIILQKPKKGKKGNKEEQAQEQLLIFVIDVSPSMGNSVTNKLSRLDCVRQAVEDEIKKMKMERSQKIVGIISFGSQVVIFDHKKGKTVTMDSKNFEDFKKIAKDASGYSIKEWGPINKKYQIIQEIVKKLPTSYGTAIGPALLTAVEIAAKGPTGSRVIICTDGEANVGIGSHGKQDPFYYQIGEYAKDKGVSVNVLGIKGVDINLKLLGKVTHATGGSVMKVDPLKIGTQFSKIINEQILGSNSEVIVRLNKRFIFKNVDKKLLSEKNTLLIQNLGNFSTETELAFEFQILTVQQAFDQVHINLDIFRNNKLPMQVELQYTGLNGTRYLQIITDWRQIGGNEKDVIAEVDFSIFIINALQKISKFISDGQLEKAGTFYKQVETALKESVAKSKQAKQDVVKYRKRLETLKKILKKRSKKKNLKIFKDQSESDAEEDDADSDRNRSRSRSRSRDRVDTGRGGRGGRGGGRGASRGRGGSSRGVSATKRKSRKQRIQIESMSSSQEQAVIYKQMKATEDK